MSHIDASALAAYNSLSDPHLSGYFSNGKKRKHLQKAGLIKRNGEIISETTYRLTMARKEHKKHVRDLLAQAIVHRTLDMERSRQVAIKTKLEEIAKIEMVRRVRSERGRKGDEDILPYLTPRRGRSRPATASGAGQRSRSQGSSKRPKSAPNKRSSSADDNIVVVDEDGMPITPRSYESGEDSRSPSPSDRPKSGKKGKKGGKQGKYPKEEIDDKHLYALNRQTLYDYTMAQQSVERGGGTSPYVYSQLPPDVAPQPPKSPKGKRGGGRRASSAKQKEDDKNKGNKGSLMLHRQEPAMKHQERVQTMADVTIHYFGSNLKLDYEKFDPRDDIVVEQQHCGGNTLAVFKDKVLPGHDFTFTSRRHRGYPFGLTLYINGTEDCRLSACCEFKHPAGARLGGKKGHFGIVGVSGSAPCYKCQINSNSSGKDKKKSKKKKSKKQEETEEEDQDNKSRDDVDVQGYGDDGETQRSNKSNNIKVPVEEDAHTAKEENYSDNDFEDDDDGKRESSRPSSRSSRSRSRSRSSSKSSRSSRSKSSSRSRSRSRSRSKSTDRSSDDTKKSEKEP